MRQIIRAGKAMPGRILLVTPLDQLADVAGREATLERLRDHFPTATVALHASAGDYGRWWALLQGELPTLTCLAVWPRPDGSLGRGCVDALGEALERGIPCVLASPRGVVERFSLIRGDDGAYARAGLVLPDADAVAHGDGRRGNLTSDE